MRASVLLIPVAAALMVAVPHAQSGCSVLENRKISDTHGGLGGVLDEGDFWGQGLAFLGDLDGDGCGDLAASSPEDSDGALWAGAVWILFLNHDGSVRAKQKISHTEGGLTAAANLGDFFGIGVANLGDLDGDGRPELAVGTEESDGGNSLGSVYVLSLDTDGTVAAQTKISATSGGFTGTLQEGDAFGRSLARLGDLDGDGITEVAVGAIGDEEGGAVWILFLNADGTVKDHQKLSATEGGFGGPSGSFSYFGGALAPLGDLDGDGVPDLAAGDQYDTDGGSATGAVYILFLHADGTVKAEQKISALAGNFSGNLADVDLFGASLATLGDCDGDGTVDLAVGAPEDDHGGFNAGAVWLLFLDADGTVRDERKIGARTGGFGGDLTQDDDFGMGVAGLGDLDGDGRFDLAVGAVGDDDGGDGFYADLGAVWMLFLDGLVTIDFERENDSLVALGNGREISAANGFGALLQIEGAPAGSGLTAALFDSTPGGPNDPGPDPDLLVDRGNVLILQGTPGQTVPGFYDSPDDDAAGGDFQIAFGGDLVEPRSIQLVDLAAPVQGATVTLFDRFARARTFVVPAGWTGDVAVDGPPGYGRLDLTTLANQPGFAATATASEDLGFDATRVLSMTVHLEGSGALDDLVVRRPVRARVRTAPAPQLPGPSIVVPH